MAGIARIEAVRCKLLDPHVADIPAGTWAARRLLRTECSGRAGRCRRHAPMQRPMLPLSAPHPALQALPAIRAADARRIRRPALEPPQFPEALEAVLSDPIRSAVWSRAVLGRQHAPRPKAAGARARITGTPNVAPSQPARSRRCPGRAGVIPRRDVPLPPAAERARGEGQRLGANRRSGDGEAQDAVPDPVAVPALPGGPATALAMVLALSAART